MTDTDDWRGRMAQRSQEGAQFARSLTGLDPDVLRRDLQELGSDWAEKKRLFGMAKARVEHVEAKLIEHADGNSVTAREAWVHRHKDYVAAVQAKIDTEKDMDEARIKYDVEQIVTDFTRTLESTLREFMRR